MAQRKIVWHTQAYQRYSCIISWYMLNCGSSFAQKFIDDVATKLETLSFMPAIGKVKRIVGKKHYAEFVSHPKMKIRYWFDDEELHIIDLKPAQMQ